MTPPNIKSNLVSMSSAKDESALNNAGSSFTLVELAGDIPNFYGLTGRTSAMRQLILQLERMAPYLVLATVEGENGTGRSHAARALHAAGPAAKQGAFVPCLASHFFSAQPPGHSGSYAPEIVQKAHGGMLFLDGVDQLSTAQQDELAEFLHWFDDRRFHAALRGRSNADLRATYEEGPLPAQIVFSTSHPLLDQDGPQGFRHDVASRLCAVRFCLPALRDRREDIPLLAQIFLQDFARSYNKPVRGLGPGAVAPLVRYAWPGNVRELEDVITAAALKTDSQWIRPSDLPTLERKDFVPSGSIRGVQETPSDFEPNLDRAIRRHVVLVLKRTRGNKLRAAQLLGISRSTLYRILGGTKTP